MARLWKHNPQTPGGKYLALRRDGTVPEWLWFVLGSRALALEYEQDLLTRGAGDPDAGRHRADDPATVARMRGAGGS